MTKEKILIFGASDYTSYTIDVLEKQNEYEIFGILDYNIKKDYTFNGYRILGNDDDLPEIPDPHQLFSAAGRCRLAACFAVDPGPHNPD